MGRQSAIVQNRNEKQAGNPNVRLRGRSGTGRVNHWQAGRKSMLESLACCRAQSGTESDKIRSLQYIPVQSPLQRISICLRFLLIPSWSSLPSAFILSSVSDVCSRDCPPRQVDLFKSASAVVGDLKLLWLTI